MWKRWKSQFGKLGGCLLLILVYVHRTCGLLKRWCRKASAINRFEHIWLIFVKLSQEESVQTLPSHPTRTKRSDSWRSKIPHHIWNRAIQNFNSLQQYVDADGHYIYEYYYFSNMMDIEWHLLINSNIKSKCLYIFSLSYHISSKLRSLFCRTLFT